MVIYYSKYGSTKQYAEWLSEELHGDLVTLKESDKCNFSAYDAVLIGSGVYAGNLKIKKNLIETIRKNANAKIYVFGVGATPPTEELTNEIAAAVFKSAKDKIEKMYLFRGKFNFSELSVEDKLMMGMYKAMITRKNELGEAERAILKCFDEPESWISRDAITCMVKDITEACENSTTTQV